MVQKLGEAESKRNSHENFPEGYPTLILLSNSSLNKGKELMGLDIKKNSSSSWSQFYPKAQLTRKRRIQIPINPFPNEWELCCGKSVVTGIKRNVVQRNL